MPVARISPVRVLMGHQRGPWHGAQNRRTSSNCKASRRMPEMGGWDTRSYAEVAHEHQEVDDVHGTILVDVGGCIEARIANTKPEAVDQRE
jgi:hypothetical protein